MKTLIVTNKISHLSTDLAVVAAWSLPWVTIYYYGTIDRPTVVEAFNKIIKQQSRQLIFLDEYPSSTEGFDRKLN